MRDMANGLRVKIKELDIDRSLMVDQLCFMVARDSGFFGGDRIAIDGLDCEFIFSHLSTDDCSSFYVNAFRVKGNGEAYKNSLNLGLFSVGKIKKVNSL